MSQSAVYDKCAIITLVTSDDFVIGAVVLAYSLSKAQSAYPRLCMITSNLTQQSVDQLIDAGYTILTVNPLPNPNHSHVQSWIDTGFTKLRIFSLIDWSCLLYIDADCIVVRNVDWLFDRIMNQSDNQSIDDVIDQMIDTSPKHRLSLVDSPTIFAAAPDMNPPDRFNAGVMLIKPNQSVYQSIVTAMPIHPSYDGGDTGFLNHFFYDWFESASPCRLPFGCNALRVADSRKQPGYWDSINQSVKSTNKLSIIHLCSSPKPWERRTANPSRPDAKWWELHDEWKTNQSINQLTVQCNHSIVDMVAHPLSLVQRTLTFPTLPLAVDFDESMTQRPIRPDFWLKDDKPFIDRVKSICQQFAQYQLQPNSVNSINSSIPKHIHQIWLGGAMPEKLQPYVDSWHRYHPQWQYTMWDDQAVNQFPHATDRVGLNQQQRVTYDSHMRRCMNEAVNLAEKSDILRIDLLIAYGGIYADCDFEALASFDWLHDLNNCRAYAGLSNTGTLEINNGLFACQPGHPALVKYACEIKPASERKHEKLGIDVIDRTGPGAFTRTINSYINHSDNNDWLILPCSFLHPLPNTMRGLTLEQEKRLFYQCESLAVHHWACSWQKSTNGESVNSQVDHVEKLIALSLKGKSKPAADISSTMMSNDLLSKIANFL